MDTVIQELVKLGIAGIFLAVAIMFGKKKDEELTLAIQAHIADIRKSTADVLVGLAGSTAAIDRNSNTLEDLIKVQEERNKALGVMSDANTKMEQKFSELTVCLNRIETRLTEFNALLIRAIGAKSDGTV